MRWLVAGLCFALMVAVAVATAAFGSVNVSVRKRIERQAASIVDCEIDLIRQRHVLARETNLEALAARWERITARFREP
jgi:hypothetical protein